MHRIALLALSSLLAIAIVAGSTNGVAFAASPPPDRPASSLCAIPAQDSSLAPTALAETSTDPDSAGDTELSESQLEFIGIIILLYGVVTLLLGLSMVICSSVRSRKSFVPVPADQMCPNGHKAGPEAKFCPECGERLEQELVQELTTGDYLVASGLRRFAAQIVDYLILVIGLGLLVQLPLTLAGLDAALWDLLNVSFQAVYFIALWTLWGKSVGKAAFRMKVVTQSGAKPRFEKAATRYVVIFLLGLIILLPWWPLIWRKDNRGIHDLVAGTWVVWAQTKPALPPIPREIKTQEETPEAELAAPKTY